MSSQIVNNINLYFLNSVVMRGMGEKFDSWRGYFIISLPLLGLDLAPSVFLLLVPVQRVLIFFRVTKFLSKI